MAALATLDDVKAVAQADLNIQAMHDSDLAVTNALVLADKMVSVDRYGDLTLEAQIYFTAHILSLAVTGAGGQGPLSSETIGGVSQSFTLPYLNRKTVIASTQYGVMFLELRDSVTVKAIVVPSA
jgi:Protein of unknown function (DUF4054)